MTDTTGMPDIDHVETTAPRPDHGSGGDAHGSDGATMGEPLGAVDVMSWGYALAGAVLGVLVVLALLVARG
jgi:hypothetical protein